VGKKVLCVNVNAHNKQMTGILNTSPTASVSLGLVLALCLWEKYFQICNLDLLIKANLTGDQKCCKIQCNRSIWLVEKKIKLKNPNISLFFSNF